MTQDVTKTQGDSLPQSFTQGPRPKSKPAKVEQAEALDRATKMQMYDHLKLGQEVYYKGSVYRIVSKTGEYLRIISDSERAFDIHFTDSIPANDIYSVLWNKTHMEQRTSLLTKCKVPLEYATRNWFELPTVLKSFS